jgi:hypothetical protein
MAAIPAVASGCGGSGYRYVANSGEGAYFKLPSAWRLFNEHQFLADARGVSLREVRDEKTDLWFRGFDAADRPALANVFSTEGSQPHGFASVQPLSPDQRDTLSLASLRSMVVGFDPLKIDAVTAEAAGLSDVEVMANKDITMKSGHHGERIVFQVTTTEGKRGVFDQTTVVDRGSRTLYVFFVGCSDRCYQANRSTIATIADSWTIKER